MEPEDISHALPLLVYLAGAIIIVASMLIGSALLGQRHMEWATGEVFESGIESTGTAKLRLYPRFYLIAMFFVIFDLESIYLFAWSIAVRELGWPGFFAALFFAAMVIVALIYLWRSGGLNFGPVMRQPVAADTRVPDRPAVVAPMGGGR